MLTSLKWNDIGIGGSWELLRACGRREAEIQLLLGGNEITSLHGLDADLSRVTCLSLKGNKLRRLPSQLIRLLCPAVYLDVTNNQLEEVPMEMLRLESANVQLVHGNTVLEHRFGTDAALFSYLEQLRGGTEELNEARLFLVGACNVRTGWDEL